MPVTLSEIVTLAKLLHQANATSPMLVTLFGIVYPPAMPPGYSTSVV